MASPFRTYIRSRPGDGDWEGFCEYVRSFLYYDTLSGYVRYRPRDASHFPWIDAAAAVARDWNNCNADREVRVHDAGGKYRSCVRFDGATVSWWSVRRGLGCHLFADVNRTLPDPRRMTDAEIVDRWGIDFALRRVALQRADAAKNAETYAAALAALAAAMGRRLTLAEARLATGEWQVVRRGGVAAETARIEGRVVDAVTARRERRRMMP